MKKNKNYTWLVVGIITILAGILIPLFAFNQTTYYEVKKNEQTGNVSFYVSIVSKEEIKDIENATVVVEYSNNEEDKEYEVYSFKKTNEDNKFYYSFQIIETQNWKYADSISSVKIRTMDGVVEIEEKIGWGTKVPIMVFASLIGLFMVFVHFFNNNAKNRTNEIKEIIASSAYEQNSYEEIPEIVEEDNEEQTQEIVPEPQSQVEETKACDYCGTLSDANDKVCASCGAKFKKRN